MVRSTYYLFPIVEALREHENDTAETMARRQLEVRQKYLPENAYDLAETIAGYHRQATIIEYANDRESVGKVTAPMLDNFAPLQQTIDMDLLTRVQQWTRSSLQDLKPTLIQRRKDGFMRVAQDYMV